jgi:acetate---CoA ligase (ADP-forming)
VSRTVADLLFRPRTVVVVGASSDPGKLSGRPLDYLLRFGFQGTVYAVNPHRETVQGVPAFPSVDHLPQPADLAIIVVPAASVLDAVRECGKAGVGAAIVFASGFAEVGGHGAAAEAELADIARESGLRILGPNCLGSFALADNVFATFSTAFDDPDVDTIDSPIALVSQSGAVGTFTYSMMTAAGVGVRYYANPGNQTDITVIEVLQALVAAPDVSLLMGHLEDGTDMVALEELAEQARAAGKPLLLLKAGASTAGARAVRAHTGSVAGDDAAFDAVVGKHGAVRVRSMEEWADAALAFESPRSVAGSRVTIVTQSGGAGALAADVAVGEGLSVDTWKDPDALAALAESLPGFASVKNPIDLTGAMINDVALLESSLDRVLVNDDTDAVLVVLGNSDTGADGIVDALISAHAGTDKPFFVAWTGGSGRPRTRLLSSGVPTYTDPTRAVHALAHVVRHSLTKD